MRQTLIKPASSKRLAPEKKIWVRSPTNLVAFLCLVVSVGVWEMNVAPCLLHHPLDVVSTFANNVRVLCVGNVHLKCYPVTLKSRKDKAGVK